MRSQFVTSKKEGIQTQMVRKRSQISIPEIEDKIFLIRKGKVMLDSDLAELYGVTTKRLNEQVRRNLDRFPKDFMFQLTKAEDQNLKSQIATSKKGHGGRRKLPYAFTEHGAIMLASVLNSERAVETSILVVRAFVRLRKMLSTQKKIMQKITELERRQTGQDQDLRAIFTALKQLMTLPTTRKKQIGFERKR